MGNPTYLAITRNTLLGISLTILALFLIVTAVTAEFDPESLFFIGPLVIVPLLVSLALRRWRGKTIIVGAVVGILLILINAPFPDIFNPTATVDFILMSTATFGGLIVLIAASVGFIKRNAIEPATAPQALQYGFALLVVVPLLAAIGGGIAWVAGGSDVSASDKAEATAIQIKNFDFHPDEVTSQSTKLLVSNDDLFRHTFTVEDLGIDVELNPGRDSLIDISGKPAGSYEIICAIEGHESMKSTLIVQ